MVFVLCSFSCSNAHQLCLLTTHLSPLGHSSVDLIQPQEYLMSINLTIYSNSLVATYLTSNTTYLHSFIQSSIGFPSSPGRKPFVLDSDQMCSVRMLFGHFDFNVNTSYSTHFTILFISCTVVIEMITYSIWRFWLLIVHQRNQPGAKVLSKVGIPSSSPFCNRLPSNLGWRQYGIATLTESLSLETYPSIWEIFHSSAKSFIICVCDIVSAGSSTYLPV